VHPPTEFYRPYGLRRSPEMGPVSARRHSQRKSRTFWLKLEIGRSESPAEETAGRVPAEATPSVTYGAGTRGRFGRVRRRRVADQIQGPPAGADHPSNPEQTASDRTERAATGPATGSFWEELDPAEREALLMAARSATFAIGDKLMREGEPADYVIVLIEGQTRVVVEENGWERVLAERGPGQLIGERGGLQVRLRSASVIAIEPVRALVITTEAFSAFVNAHPRVFDIVERQLYDRLIEDRAPYHDQDRPGFISRAGAVRQPAGARFDDALTARLARPGRLNGQHCTILLTDVVAFGSPARNDEDRRIIREALSGMTHMTVRGLGARSEGRGDGILTVVPSDVPTADIVERLVKELPAALARHNAAVHDSARFQLRVAINVGPVATDTMGISGEAIIIAARLVEAPIFKEAMVRTRADLGIITASFVYDVVIRHSPNPIDLVGYSQVDVRLKDFAASAWVKVFTTPAPLFCLSPSIAASDFDSCS
jgi:CRP-like cAMP-binding protein